MANHVKECLTYPINLYMYQYKEGISRASSIYDLVGVERLLSFLSNFYPDFNTWYINKIEDRITDPELIVLINRTKGIPTGLAIGKRTDYETKLRCVRVHPDLQSSGLGFRLIERMFDLLDTDQPHCTVPEEMLHLYSRAFINRYRFNLNQVIKGEYRPSKLEYHFN